MHFPLPTNYKGKREISSQTRERSILYPRAPLRGIKNAFFARRRHSVDKGWPNLRCQIIKTPLPSLQLLLHTGIMIKSDQGRDGPHIARSSKANGVKKQKNSIVKKERKPLKTTYPIHNAPLWSELPVRSTFNGIHFHIKKKSCCRPHLVFKHT